MMTSTKNYTKEREKKQTDRTLRQMVKAKLYRQKSHKVHHLNFGMIRCLFRYSTDAGYIKLIVEI